MSGASAIRAHGAVDACLQDSYLLVVELQQGASVEHGAGLWKHCTEQVEKTRQGLHDAGYDERSIERICYAQCALLDETVLNHAVGDSHAVWASRPLQAHFFNRHQAGFQLYEDMREALAEPELYRGVLTCYHRVLMLGFKGCYPDPSSPERQHLATALSEHIEPLSAASHELAFAARPSLSLGRWLHTPWLHVLLAAFLLGGLWWGLNHLLAGELATLFVRDI